MALVHFVLEVNGTLRPLNRALILFPKVLPSDKEFPFDNYFHTLQVSMYLTTHSKNSV